MSWSFACDGDLHLDAVSKPTKTRKPNSVAKLRSYKDKLDFVVCVGDMIDHGADGSRTVCTSCSKNVADEFTEFVESYLAPLESASMPCKLCLGNHDYSKSSYPGLMMIKYIRDRHQATFASDPDMCSCYFFDHKGVRFIVMGVFPKNIAWLKFVLDKTVKGVPIVFIYHYNTDPSEPWADWWKDDQRELFFTAIAGLNVIAIINGHWHASMTKTYRGIPIIHASGEDRLCIVKMTDKGTILAIDHI